MKIVLDTNVLVSGVLSPNGIPAQILNLVLEKKVTLITDTRILAEYSEVLKRPKFGFKPEWINPLLDFIKMESELVIPEPINISFPDPDDIMFWEVAKTGKALYIVSGNLKHFPEDPMVVSPAHFMEKYHKQMLR
ncbi:MAG: putative toxin-antitoxin system toxin component, PIN family [Spirochaetales bacterium]|nr:putative toxin-antitoxin system toxin component, PIN family [Spirochaetales bacterium]